MKIIRVSGGIFLFLIGFLVVGYLGFRLAFKGLIFPGVMISGIDLSGMDKMTASLLVKRSFNDNPSKVFYWYKDKQIADSDSIKVNYDFNWVADQAILVGRNGNVLTQVKEQLGSLINKREVTIPINYDTNDIDGLIGAVAQEVIVKPVWPKLQRTKDGLSLTEGVDGVEIDTEQLKKQTIAAFTKTGRQDITIETKITAAKVDEKTKQRAIGILNKWEGKKLRLKYRNFETSLDQERILRLIGLSAEKINSDEFAKLVEEIKPGVETEPKDAVFVFEEGKVKEFKPEIIGAKIETDSFKKLLVERIENASEEEINVPVKESAPKIKTGDINNLGIKELVGEGKSSFAHSIPGRVFNVNLAAQRINGSLIAPGAEFSFNDAVGEISKSTGYQSAYIISGGRTVLGDGGGVCQVSTTVFRAVLNAGLPVTERKGHAYRVGYYEQDSKPGLDATVFSPSADLKFKNDTGNYLLIQTNVDTANLKMKVDIYGANDGRKSTVSTPVVYDQTPAPAAMYVDDPTLPLGQTKQIDWAAPGAKVSFTYKVERGGEILSEKTFYTNYQPWQAVYLKGTKQ